MTKLKRFTVVALAAVAVAVGGLAATPTASAAPMSCHQAVALAEVYWSYGLYYYRVGDYFQAGYWFGKYDDVLETFC